MPRPASRFVVLLALAVGCGEPTSAIPSGRNGTVTIAVDFGGRSANKSFAVPITGGQPAIEAMRTASDEGELEFETTEHTGSPFVSGIDGVSGEGGGDDLRNWMYWINGDLATVGIGSLKLQDGDELTWRFTTYDEAQFESSPASDQDAEKAPGAEL